MANYYKATRPDGTDFYTGTVLYEVGKRTTHPTSKRRTKDDCDHTHTCMFCPDCNPQPQEGGEE